VWLWGLVVMAPMLIFDWWKQKPKVFHASSPLGTNSVFFNFVSDFPCKIRCIRADNSLTWCNDTTLEKQWGTDRQFAGSLPAKW
jgi:hypothetical protein